MAERKPTLVALTEASEVAFRDKSVAIDRWPFRVGRDRRSRSRQPENGSADRRGAGARPGNDLYLHDPHRRKYISRNHFLLECRDGRFYLVDLESACGTWVNGKEIGSKRRGGRAELNSGDEIAIGGRKSPFRYRFELG